MATVVKGWTRRKEARPAEILEAALALFAEKGFTATKMEDIAKRAGVTTGTPYRYFANKEEIFKAVVRESLIPQISFGEEMLSQFHGSGQALLEEVLRSWWQGVGETNLSGLPKLIIAEAGNFPDLAKFYYEEVIERGVRLIGRVITYGVERGDFRPVDVDYTVRVVMAPVIMGMIWKHSLGVCEREPIDTERYLKTVIELLLSGLTQPQQPANPASLEIPHA
ncbi:TetR/AcrR family transcriptional regulator [Parachitinimonas caeni]|uniref:TetR/AcrR family transcriptional regulator n=1 Tax=Parachitinimonas caeni TaxID=3031301 RepID=A0ABT7E1W6_9NEIS|nr:TetR/AcrR family transcriptional regulator [Parachitinimonas caeni]MDK2126296.1 TetR/AcrR family transcriptional regulator [Parachitinimonas caeni]